MQNDKRKAVDRLAVTLVVIGAGMLARSALERGWSRALDKSPPSEKSNEDAELGEVVSWALLSGALVGLARSLARRGASSGFARKRVKRVTGG
jgi:hypothetical protein